MSQRDHRIIGYDIARALAIISMVFVNYRFALVSPDYQGSHWFLRLTELFPCREAAMFVILAGIGTSLAAWRTSRDGRQEPVLGARWRLVKRALVLLASGWLNSLVWNADILRFFSLYMLVGAIFMFSATKVFGWAIGLFTVAFPLVLTAMSYDAEWSYKTMDYLQYRTFPGVLKGLFFNGHHPLIPWMSFYLTGMYLGRLDLVSDTPLRHRAMLVSAVVAVAAEAVSLASLKWLHLSFPQVPLMELEALTGRQPFPPMPLFVLQAGATAVFVIALCIEVTSRIEYTEWLTPLIYLGELSLTVYVAHAWIGLGILIPFGSIENSTPLFAASAAGVFLSAAIVFAALWKRSFGKGPAEWLLRRLAG
jgi:uncharacterized protein